MIISAYAVGHEKDDEASILRSALSAILMRRFCRVTLYAQFSGGHWCTLNGGDRDANDNGIFSCPSLGMSEISLGYKVYGVMYI